MVDRKNSKLFKKSYEEKRLSLSALKNLKKDTTASKLNIPKKGKLEKEKISIIILTYNRLNQLIRLLNSIYSQNYSNYEIILIDDVSTDGTYEYFQTIQEDRLNYIRHSEKIDTGLNRQTAFNMATGDYVIFCDDDDYFIDDNYFSDAVKIFKDKDINMICSSSYIYYENNDTYEEFELNFSEKIDSLKYLEKFQFELKKPTSTFPMIARKSALDKANMKKMKMVNDSSIYLRGLMVGGYTYANNKIIGIYRIHNSNMTSNVKTDFIIKNLDEKKYVYNYLKNTGVSFDLDKWLEDEIKLTVLYCFAGNKESKYKRKRLLLWVLKNVSYKLYKELCQIEKKELNKNEKIDIIRGLCIILILLYNSCLLMNQFVTIEPFFAGFVLYVYFIICGYRFFSESIKRLLQKFKNILAIFLIGLLFLGIYTSLKNDMSLLTVVSKVTSKKYMMALLNHRNIYNGFSILLLTCICYLMEMVKRIHKKSTDLYELILLAGITLITKSNYILCLMLYILGRIIKDISLEKRIRKRYFIIAIPTLLLLVIETIIFKKNIYFFSIALGIILAMAFIRINKSKYENIKIFGNRIVFYIISVYSIISILLLDFFKKLNNSYFIETCMYSLLVLLLCIIVSLPLFMLNQSIREKKKKKRKSCLVIGYMNNNFGDDLFFKILFNRYKTVDFYMYPPSNLLEEYQEKFLNNKNVIFYDEEDDYIKLLEKTENDNKRSKDIWVNIFPMICERAKKVDFSVNIGGSIFIQGKDWKKDDRFKLKDIMKDKPSFIIGCNFGPGDEEYYNYYKNWFKGFNDICFRDKESYEKFKDLGNTRLADDVVLIYTENHKYHPIGYNKTIGISVMDPLNTKKLKNVSKEYYNFITSSIKYYISMDFRIKLYAFCPNEGDLKTANNIANKLSAEELKKVEIIEYGRSINKFTKKWKQSKYIIGTRFHANILAITHGQSFLPIIYSDKTYNYLKNIDESIEIHDILELCKMKKNKLVYNKVTLNYSSEEQFTILDNYINGGSK